MIVINKEINPEREVYYLGAAVIDVLKSFATDTVDMLDIFQELNKKKRISMNLFVLTLDWLYITGCIKQHNGQIAKCF